jgi:hypothetical protein
MEYRVRFVRLTSAPEALQSEIEAVCNKLGLEGFQLIHTEPGLVAATNGIFLFFERR